MGSFANSLFSLLLGWTQGLISSLWKAFSSGNDRTLFQWLGNHWKGLAIALCIIGTLVDFVVYLLRWKPYRVWESFFRRFGKKTVQEDSEEVPEQKSDSGGYADPAEENGYAQIRELPGESGRTAFHEPDLRRRQEEDEKPVLRRNAEDGVIQESSPYGFSGAAENEPAVFSMYAEDPEEELGRSHRKKLEETLRKTRRRRSYLNELLSDENGSQKTIESPQELFDSKEAYYQPVYPQKWRTDGDRPS